MTTEKQAPPKTRAKQAGGKFGPNYTREQKELAYKLWQTNDHPSFRDLANMLAEKHGMPGIDRSTVKKWKDANPQWDTEWKKSKHPLDPESLLDALAQAKEDAKNLDPDHLSGVKTALVAQLYIAIREMKMPTVDDWERALDCCSKLEALIHAERGKVIGTEPKTGKPVSLVASLGQPVTVAPFKKAASTNGTNGGGH